MAAITLQESEKLLETPEPPELGPGPRKGVESEATLNRRLKELLGGTDWPEERQQLVRALVLLWHDHLEAAHVIAQEIENADGAFVHGIMHRREPDYGNAAYWFRRVGKHPAFPEIARRAAKTLQRRAESNLIQKLTPAGEWDPFLFINACESAARNPSATAEKELV